MPGMANSVSFHLHTEGNGPVAQAFLHRILERRNEMNGRTFLTAVGVAALLSASGALAQGKSGSAPGATVSSTARGGGMAGGMGAAGMGPASPMGVGAGSLLTGIDRATEATGGNANATAGFTSAMDLRAAAQERRATARANAKAKANANAMAIEKANENSVLNDPDD